MIYIILYLIAIVLANLSVQEFGASAVYINAFIFIGLDLTVRDKLHDRWANKYLVVKMGTLIFVGSLLSWFFNREVFQIALASWVGFSISGVVDAVVYGILHNKTKLVRINGSNIFAALADSIIFPSIAFGSFSLLITLGQFLAKIFGGFVWSLILERLREKGNKNG